METKLRRHLSRCRKSVPCPHTTRCSHDPSQAVYFINKDDVNQSNVEIVGLGTDRHNPDVAVSGGDERDPGRRLRKPVISKKVRTELGLAYAVGAA